MRSPLPVGEGAGVRAYRAQNDSVFWGLGWSTTTFLATVSPLPRPLSQGERGDSIWTHFGGNAVSPKWSIEDGRDIWVVKCAASLRRKRSVFEENGHLTTPMSQKELRLRLGDQNGHQSASR